MDSVSTDIEAFRKWATNLGFAHDEMPPEDFLKSVFKSKQREIFVTMMERIKPIDEVNKIRRAVTAKILDDLENNVLSPAERANLPKNIRDYLKLKELQKKRDEIKKRVEEYRSKHVKVIETNQELRGQLIAAREKRDELKKKVIILQVKEQKLDEQINLEEQRKQELCEIIPAITTPDSQTSSGDDAVNDAIRELKTYYESLDNNPNNDSFKTKATDALFVKIRHILGKTPDTVIFNALMRSLDQSIQDIIKINSGEAMDCGVDTTPADNNTGPLADLSQVSTSSATSFEHAIAKAEIKAIHMAKQYFEARKMHDEQEKAVFAACSEFVEGIKLKLKASDPSLSDERIDQIAGEYAELFNKCNYLKEEINFLKKNIEKYSKINKEHKKEVDEHEIMKGVVEKLYKETEVIVNEVNNDLELIGQIKEKILFTFNITKELLREFIAKHTTTSHNINSNTLNFPKVQINSNMMTVSAESFNFTFTNIGGDNILSSTKLSTSSSPPSTPFTPMTPIPTIFNTNANPGPHETVEQAVNASHSMELEIFNKLPLKKLSFRNAVCDFYAGYNPFVMETDKDSMDFVKLIPATELTPYGITCQIRKIVMWAELIKSLASEVKLNLEMPIVDAEHYNKLAKEQHDGNEELLDKIMYTTTKTKRTLDKATKIYEFILDNPLPSFIPSSRRYNNTTYIELENEYKAYYRIITAHESSKK